MPTFRITDPTSGKVLRVTGDSPPTEAELTQLFASVQPPQDAPQTPTVEVPQGPSMGDRAIGAMLPGMPPDVARGVAKGVGQTAIGLADLAATGLRHVPGVRNVVPDESTFDALREKVAPTNTQQKIGAGVEHAAEFFAPGAALGKLKGAAKTGMGFLDALASAGIEGASSMAVQTAQQGSPDGAVGAGIGAAGIGLGAQGLAKGAGWAGKRIESALVKASAADRADGFKVENIFKHKLGGTLSDTYDKANALIKEKADKVKTYLNISNQLGRKVNLLDELAAVAADLEANSAKTFGQNASVRNAVNKLLDDPFFQRIAPNGEVDLSTANELKQAVGEMGAWLHDPSGRIMADPDSRAMEKVANALYAKLKTQIEKQSIGPISALNRTISEVLPIRQAIIRRIPVEERANVLNMGDLLSFASGQWGLALANRMAKSGQTANAMVNLAEKAPAIAPAVTRGVSGARASAK